MTDLINHPPHYTSSAAKCTCGRTIECIDVVRHLSFNLGNVLKYCWRADLKGDSLADLRKAAFYIADEIAKREAEQPKKPFDISNCLKCGEFRGHDHACDMERPETAELLAEIEKPARNNCTTCKHDGGQPTCADCDASFTKWEPRA